ncbi:MAG TPA: hypothetical protein VMT22_03995 [Terriglobales bacterium]|jgi:hypothetical protein|nr:hypothetical protein [Terriglobales bacterium]
MSAFAAAQIRGDFEKCCIIPSSDLLVSGFDTHLYKLMRVIKENEKAWSCARLSTRSSSLSVRDENRIVPSPDDCRDVEKMNQEFVRADGRERAYSGSIVDKCSALNRF